MAENEHSQCSLILSDYVAPYNARAMDTSDIIHVPLSHSLMNGGGLYWHILINLRNRRVKEQPTLVSRNDAMWLIFIWLLSFEMVGINIEDNIDIRQTLAMWQLLS